ncbi:hypothetical protein X777_05105 [Ooceraea biroi]|uniref:Uncharacterized protein n=1 Tax=Ooceraea biroi TaxID=2015173 RepID=A0A026WFC2_OOCBI|nr:hypothetical protein X777_05105 [Ooceraea biroi]
MRAIKGRDAGLTFRRCGGFLGGVIDVMNEYREEFSLRVAREREREGVGGDGSGTFPRCILKPTIHGAASAARRLSRNTCGSLAAVLRSEIRQGELRHVALLRYIHATLFYLCLNIPKHCAARAPCHSVDLRYIVSPTTLSNIRPPPWTFRGARDRHRQRPLHVYRITGRMLGETTIQL